MAHTHIIGQTGTGKTTLLLHALLQNISYTYKRLNRNRYNGVCFIDPDGAAIDLFLEHIPKRRRRHVVVFDPTQSVNWNPLTDRLAVSLVDDLAAVNRYEISANLFYETGLYTFLVFQEAGLNIGEVVAFLKDKKTRTKVLSKISDPFLQFHWQQFDKLSDRDQDAATRSFKTTFSILLADERVRKMFRKQESSFTIEPETIFLARLPVAELGEKPVGMIGTLLLGQLHATGLPLYVDSCDLFAHTTLRKILQRGDSSLTVTHQTLDQLDPRLKTALLGNAAHRHVFRVSIRDADELERMTEDNNTDPALFELEPFVYRTFPRLKREDDYVEALR